MRAAALLLAKAKRRPLRAAVDLAFDYATYVGMVAFLVALYVSRWPLWLLERATGLRVRRSIIDLVARVARG